MKKRISALLCILSVLLLVSCGKEGHTGESEAETVHLNIAKQMVPGYMPLYIMEDGKWLETAYEKAGYQITVTYTEFESGPPENEAFATDQMDVGVMGNVPAISGIAAGQKRDIIGIAYNGEQTLGILVSPEAELSSVEELRGKKVGIVIGSIAQDFLHAILENAGLSMEDVTLVNLGISEMEAALSGGQVDALAVWNPTMLKLCEDGTGKLLADGSGVYAGENVIVARQEYLEQNPEVIAIFMDQYEKAVDELLNNMDEYAEKYASVTGLSPELLKKTWESSRFPVWLSEKDAAELEQTAQFLYEQKLIGSEVEVSEYLYYPTKEED